MSCTDRTPRSSAARIPSHVDANLMQALGADAALLLVVDNWRSARDQRSDIERQACVHLGERKPGTRRRISTATETASRSVFFPMPMLLRQRPCTRVGR